MGIARIGGLNFALELGVIFLGIPNWVVDGFFKKNFFLNLGLKCAMEKCVDCFLVYLFLGGFFKKRGCA